MISFLLALLSFAVISLGVLDCIACTYDCVYVMVAHIIEHFSKQIKIEYISFVTAAVEHTINAYKVHIHMIIIMLVTIISVAASRRKKHLHTGLVGKMWWYKFSTTVALTQQTSFIFNIRINNERDLV